MRCTRTLIALGIVALATGCASSGQMGADGLTRLEKSRASRPNDPAVARSLGIAYYKAGRLPDARTNLDQAVRLDPRDGAAVLYLGLTAEQQNDVPGAKAALRSGDKTAVCFGACEVLRSRSKDLGRNGDTLRSRVFEKGDIQQRESVR